MNKKLPENIKKKLQNMKKEDYIVLVLIGVLLVIIGIPTEKKGRENADNTGIFQQEKEISGEGDGASQTEKETAAATEEENNNTSYDMDTYVEETEERLENILTAVEGAGKVKVMITVAASEKEILGKDRESVSGNLTETDSEGGSRSNVENQVQEEVIYLTDGEGNRIPYVVQTQLPQVTGVVVVAQGAGNEVIKENIIEAVEVLFNLSKHKIKVIKMKS